MKKNKKWKFMIMVVDLLAIEVISIQDTVVLTYK